MRRSSTTTALLISLLSLVHSASAGPADFTQPDAYAVVIGISQYREEVIPKVAYVVKDAEAVAKLLELDTGQTHHAPGLAGSFAGGIRQYLDDGAEVWIA